MNQIIDFEAILKYAIALLPYIPMTLALSVIATVLGTVLGLGIALVKKAKVPVLSQIIAVLVSYLRGTPPLVQLLLAVNAVPIAVLYTNQVFGTDYDALGISPFLVATVTFALIEAAYSSESIRAALLAVDPREIEAGRSLGMTPWQVLRRITVPNASVIAFPTLVNNFIGMLKASSLAFVVSVVEITAYAKILGGRDYRFFEAYLATAILYWMLTVAIEQVARIIEQRMQLTGRADRGNRFGFGGWGARRSPDLVAAPTDAATHRPVVDNAKTREPTPKREEVSA